MALEQDTPRVRLVAQDRTKSQTSLSWAIRRNATLATASAAFFQAVGLVDAISDCAIVGGQVEYRWQETEPEDPTGQLGAIVGVFVFTTNTPGEYAMLAVPGIRPDLTVTTGPLAGVQLDSTHPAVAAFIQGVLDGPFGSPFGVQIDAFETAFIQERP